MSSARSPIALSDDDRQQIEGWIAAMGTPQQVVVRCRIVLAAAAGRAETAIATELNLNRNTVRLWKQRFASEGISSLWEIAPGRGRKPVYTAEQVKSLIAATCNLSPKDRHTGVAG